MNHDFQRFVSVFGISSCCEPRVCDGVVRCHRSLLFPLLEGFRFERIFLCGSMSALQVFSVFDVFFDVYLFPVSGNICAWCLLYLRHSNTHVVHLGDA
jgi:hypothetical protein